MRLGRVLYWWANNFPEGAPGVGLLLARLAVGFVFLLQGRWYLMNADFASWTVGLAALALGGFLAIGLLTRVAAIFSIAGGLLVLFSVLPDCPSSLSHSNYAVILAATMLVDVLLAGPGAYSIDARLFGRREIIIPRINPSYKP